MTATAGLDTTYSPEQIDACLMVIATQGGQIRRSVPLLRHRLGITVSEATLRTWKNETHSERYFELQEDYGDSIARRAAARSMEIAELASDGVETFVQKAIDGAARIEPVTAGDVRDLATSARNLSQVQVNSVEKARLLRDQPTEVHSLESLEELVGVLQAAGVVKQPEPIDGELVEEENPALEAPA